MPDVPPHLARASRPRPRRRGLRWGLIGAVVFILAFTGARLSHRAYDDDKPTDKSGTNAASPSPTTPDWVTDGSAQRTNPLLDRELYRPPNAPAATAAAGATDPRTKDVLSRLADVPTGIWLVPERYPVGSVRPFVQEIVARAIEQDEVPVFVLYGIPQRDCSGLESSGGLTEEEYVDWIREFADAAGPVSVAILEPDALASALECGLVDQRERLLREALDVLTPGPATYVETGHSHWRKPAEMAPMLKAIGVERARGIAVNVAGYEPVSDEKKYAEAILKAIGGDGHYLIDTGRNGAGSTGEWCNPLGRAFGATPGPVRDGSALDGYLWVKPPGESDGTCGGGPAAGEYWVDRALEMATNSGW